MDVVWTEGLWLVFAWRFGGFSLQADVFSSGIFWFASKTVSVGYYTVFLPVILPARFSGFLQVENAQAKSKQSVQTGFAIFYRSCSESTSLQEGQRRPPCPHSSQGAPSTGAPLIPPLLLVSQLEPSGKILTLSPKTTLLSSLAHP